MIRIILVAMTVILYLIFSVPLLAVLRFRAKTDPVGVQKVSLGKIQGVFRFILKLAGVTYEVKGLENIPSDRAVLYVGNHRSYFDILVGYMTVPGLTGFVAKKEMLKIPLLRTWMQRVNCLFLDRVDIKEGLKTILEGIEKVKSGVSIWIFPEGTRVEHEGALPAKGGVAVIGIRSGAQFVPVYVEGNKRLFRRTRIIFGQAYRPEATSRRPSPEEVQAIADEVLRRSYALGKEAR